MESQGFRVNPHIRPASSSKAGLRRIHNMRRVEQIIRHKQRLRRIFPIVREYAVDTDKLRPENIRLRLVPVENGSREAELYFWWNLVWWSVPYEPSIGRQMRFILWDEGHNAPFGLLGLQSPPLHLGVRDRFLGLKSSLLDFWVNQSMSAHRIGALPPYNMMIGSKMVALAASSAEIRIAYASKYKLKKHLRGRILPPRLLFVTTTSAFGKSSVYDRLSYNGENVCSFIGLTAGAGTFQFSELLYAKILRFLEQRGQNVDRSVFQRGPSRKLRLIDKALDLMNLKFSYHNVKRGVYLFPHVSNLEEVLRQRKRPLWYARSFDDLARYWKLRWCLPRVERFTEWKSFEMEKLFAQARRLLA